MKNQSPLQVIDFCLKEDFLAKFKLSFANWVKATEPEAVPA